MTPGQEGTRRTEAWNDYYRPGLTTSGQNRPPDLEEGLGTGARLLLKNEEEGALPPPHSPLITQRQPTEFLGCGTLLSARL